MPRVCTICTHSLRDEIDRALLTGEPYRAIAGQFRLSKSALERHRAGHLLPAMREARDAAELARLDVLRREVVERTERIHAASWFEAMNGDLQATDRVLAAMDIRCEALGLYQDAGRKRRPARLRLDGRKTAR